MIDDIKNFVVKKEECFVDGFSEEIVSCVGYGIATAIDKETGNSGLIPIPIEIKSGSRTIDNPKCYAKAIHFKGNKNASYFLLIDSDGNLIDPWGMHKDARNSKFKKVDEDVFIKYLEYLAGRNKALYRLCDRKYRNN